MCSFDVTLVFDPSKWWNWKSVLPWKLYLFGGSKLFCSSLWPKVKEPNPVSSLVCIQVRGVPTVRQPVVNNTRLWVIQDLNSLSWWLDYKSMWIHVYYCDIDHETDIHSSIEVQYAETVLICLLRGIFKKRNFINITSDEDSPHVFFCFPWPDP